MRRHSRASEKPARSRRPKSSKSKVANLPRVASSRSSRIGAKTEVAELRRELDEAREQQTATLGVLKAMSRPTFDLESVTATVVENAVRLCGADRGFLFRFDGELKWSRLSEQIFRIDKWSLCQG